MMHERPHVKRFKDETGKTYGLLTVVELDKSQNKHRSAVWKCQCECGSWVKVTGMALRRGTTKTCGRRGCKNPNRTTMGNRYNWKGGVSVNAQGYRMILFREHPSSGKRGYVSEHRLVMEMILGRFLEPGENVHHKNGDRTDNRASNLELWSTNHPQGQRVYDKVTHAVEILKMYAPEKLSDEA